MKKALLGWLVLLMMGLLAPSVIQARSYSGMSCYNLWYSRNEIFANKGFCFEKPRSVEAFGRRCYPPYGRLNQWEEDEVNTIKNWERRKGCTGRYVRPSYTPSPTAYSGNRYARVSGIRWNDTLVVRSGPSFRYRHIADLPPNATGVEILECTKNWCHIRYGNITGWSYAKYLRSY